ncbi:MAG: sulfite exporter TauE/SafE family protein [Desulfovibrionaceae bacterium]
MPDTLSLTVFVCWFVGGFISGVTGIGGAMVAVPAAAFFLPMHEVIPLSCILNAAMDGCIACLHFRHCRIASLWPLLLGALPGSFVGLFILQAVSGAVLEGSVGLLLLSYVYWQYGAGAAPAHPAPGLGGGAAGFGAGLLGTAISFDGPPAGAYALYMGWTPRVVLGTLGVFFIIRSLFTCLLQASAGLYTPAILGYALYGIPACILGTLCAFPVVKRIRVDMFRRVLMTIIAFAGLICLWRALF